MQHTIINTYLEMKVFPVCQWRHWKLAGDKQFSRLSLCSWLQFSLNWKLLAFPTLQHWSCKCELFIDDSSNWFALFALILTAANVCDVSCLSHFAVGKISGDKNSTSFSSSFSCYEIHFFKVFVGRWILKPHWWNYLLSLFFYAQFF